MENLIAAIVFVLKTTRLVKEILGLCGDEAFSVSFHQALWTREIKDMNILNSGRASGEPLDLFQTHIESKNPRFSR